MRWPIRFVRHRDDPALDDLLATLDRLAAEDCGHAARFAAQIRRDGRKGIDRALGEVAGHLSGCASFARTTAVIAAFVRYEREANGVDLVAVTEHVRRRRAQADVARVVADAERQQRHAIAEARARDAARNLAALRAANLRRSTR